MGNDMNALLKDGQPMLTVCVILFPFFWSTPVFQILFNSFGLKGTLAVWSLIIVLLYV